MTLQCWNICVQVPAKNCITKPVMKALSPAATYGGKMCKEQTTTGGEEH
jgi:hypothetical protein